MATVFEQIVRGVKEDVEQRRARVPMDRMKELSQSVRPPRDVMGVLRLPGCGVIAEIKRASPTLGPLPPISSVAELAHQFELGGAWMVGCQTESRRFQGSLDDLKAVADAVSVPVMCRDFIVDPYQIHEARFYGADMIPLHVGLLEPAQLSALIDRVHSLSMVALVEVQNAEEATRAMHAGARVIGVNARNLASLTLNREAFIDIAPGLPDDVVKIALSGVRSAADLLTYAGAGADAVVVGTELVTAQVPSTLVRQLSAAGAHPCCPSVD